VANVYMQLMANDLGRSRWKKERETTSSKETISKSYAAARIYQPSRWSINVSVDLARGNTNIRDGGLPHQHKVFKVLPIRPTD
jgi:hypothetical protein